MTDKRTPESSGGLLTGTRLRESGEGPAGVALVTRAAGVDLSAIGRLMPHPSIEVDLPPLPKAPPPEDEDKK